MSLFGGREGSEEAYITDITNLSPNYTNESNCQRFWSRLMMCLRESQELDVLYDCRSRVIDLRECGQRHKQSLWVFRESIASMKHEKEFKKWLHDYDENFGHPPLLEAVRKVKAKVDAEGGVSILHPTVFKDPDVYIPKH
ncbi:Hypothetical protein, putative [Bodo saltans]|uniref:Uncharacterized protein n=1 Tax=Bodo saltans TaxID=75058 RepID=A0A0S4IMT7_BODSA|nr:Hypothetical protein, putative [Bodo saltans]|eukprot:CUE72947.1 Hypothetical protein, putative [Bodo saltans]